MFRLLRHAFIASCVLIAAAAVGGIFFAPNYPPARLARVNLEDCRDWTVFVSNDALSVNWGSPSPPNTLSLYQVKRYLQPKEKSIAGLIDVVIYRSVTAKANAAAPIESLNVQTPLWFIATLAAVCPLLSLLAFLMRPRPVNPCGQCGYDLTGNQSGVCPECGRGVEQVAEKSRRARVWRWAHCTLVTLSFAVAIAATIAWLPCNDGVHLWNDRLQRTIYGPNSWKESTPLSAGVVRNGRITWTTTREFDAPDGVPEGWLVQLAGLEASRHYKIWTHVWEDDRLMGDAITDYCVPLWMIVLASCVVPIRCGTRALIRKWIKARRSSHRRNDFVTTWGEVE